VANDDVFRLIYPATFGDHLTEILRSEARLLVGAFEAQVADFLARHADLKTEDVADAVCALAICLSVR
jgi:putative transposase